MILIADVSVLVDLDRTGLLSFATKLENELAVLDLLLASERRFDVVDVGIVEVELSGREMAQVVGLQRECFALSLTEAGALVWAQAQECVVVANNQVFQREADIRKVACENVLWLLDVYEEAGVEIARLYDALQAMAAHERWSVPATETNERLSGYGEKMGGNSE